jgi:prepilin-type N-terminal cleavage/methylation domain-containing protein
MKPLNRGNRLRKSRKAQAGLTLLETMIALALLLIVAAGVMGVAALALTTTENQGHLMARTAEYAQDKMEQLLALKFCDATSDTTALPTNAAGGQGLAGCAAPLNNNGTGIGGSTDPSAPVAGFVDYLDNNGNLLPTGAGGGAPAGWKYIRVWQISSANATNTVKQISVTVKVSAALGKTVALPQSTVTALKAYPF